MARYIGPTSKVARRFREPIFGRDKALEKKNYGVLGFVLQYLGWW